jgi:hypothetical protein
MKLSDDIFAETKKGCPFFFYLGTEDVITGQVIQKNHKNARLFKRGCKPSSNKKTTKNVATTLINKRGLPSVQSPPHNQRFSPLIFNTNISASEHLNQFELPISKA